MRNYRLSIQVIAGVIALVYALLLWKSGVTPEVKWLRVYTIAVLLVVMLWGAWDRWIWRAPIFQRMPFVPPNVSGTWKGELSSHWIDPDTHETIPKKNAYLVVKQTFSDVSTTLLTDESQSGSYSFLAKVNKISGLSYLYLNEPEMTASEGSHMHRGTAMFRLSGVPVETMRGRYWTDRETKGDLILEEHSSKLADSYVMASALFE